MRRLIQRLYFVIENLFMRHPAYQLLAVATVILVLSLAGGMLVYRTGPEFRDFGAALWWAFLRLTDPGYLGEDKEILHRVVSIMLTMAGYVLFLGALVAIMTNWLDRFMSFLASGRSPIFEKGHILIVGWNPRVSSLVEELVHSWKRVRRSRRRPSIAILCHPFAPGMLAQLRQKLDPDVREACRLQLREGSPLEAESLERVDYAHARSIILLSQATDSDKGSRRLLSDIRLAKVVLGLRTQLDKTAFRAEPPTVVVDVANPANKSLVESMGYPGMTEAIASDEFTGQLFCQCVRFPGIAALYGHLLTGTYGMSIVLVPVQELRLAGRTLREAIPELPSIPFGFLKRETEEETEEGRLHLLDLDSPLSHTDQLVMIRSADRPSEPAAASPGGAPRFADRWRLSPHQERDVLVVGWSRQFYPLLYELSRYQAETNRVLLVCDLDEHEARNRLATQEYSNVQLSFRRLQLHRPEDVDALRPERFHSVVLMADEQLGDPLQADAETVLAFVLIRRRLQELGSTRTAVVVELHDEDNRDLLQGFPCDVLMTQEIVSHLLAQVAVRRSLGWIYEDVFTQGGSEVRFYPFGALLEERPLPELTFDQCLRASLERDCVALGLQLREPRGEMPAGVTLNPPRALPFRPDLEDRLIVVEREEPRSERR